MNKLMKDMGSMITDYFQGLDWNIIDYVDRSEIYDSESRTYTLKVPGFEPKDIDVYTEDGKLHVEAVHEENEFSFNSTLSENVDEDNAKVFLKNGILSITFGENEVEEQPRAYFEVETE